MKRLDNIRSIQKLNFPANTRTMTMLRSLTYLLGNPEVDTGIILMFVQELERHVIHIDATKDYRKGMEMLRKKVRAFPWQSARLGDDVVGILEQAELLHPLSAKDEAGSSNFGIERLLSALSKTSASPSSSTSTSAEGESRRKRWRQVCHDGNHCGFCSSRGEDCPDECLTLLKKFKASLAK